MSFRLTKGRKITIITLLVISLVFIFIQSTLTPVFISQAEVEAVKIANRVINQVVSEESEHIRYEDLIRYVLNSNEDIILMQPNTTFINRFKSNISLKIESKLAEIEKISVKVPLFRILGIEMLAGFGPGLEAKIIPLGFTRPPVVNDSFTAAGINQTRHKIYLLVRVCLKLIVPFRSKLVEVESSVPVSEVTILGRVPHVYIGLEGEELSGIMNKQTR